MTTGNGGASISSVMRRWTIAAGVTAFALGAAACGSSYSTAPTPAPTPSPAPPPPANAVIINVVAINGAQSFSPNPATVPAGQPVVWHNVDTIVHRVVFNDGEVDTGNIAPGASSPAMFLVAPGPYHCSIHPEMVGTTRAP